MTRLETLKENIEKVLGDQVSKLTVALNELTIECAHQDLIKVVKKLRDHKTLKFEQLIDLCGVDYQDYADGTWEGSRFATVYHFLSVTLNHRIRLKVFAAEDDFPVFPTLVDLYPAANWFERESFDLYGMMYEGHPDLRRLLTDYGFVGHPFRKDFPMIGNVEMRYDPEQQRVVYQPVSIELRNNVPRVIRDEGFHNG
ncbi:MAG: NADH-quinone oxidoreductase subunit C [Burkholderiaceae bacterium]|nr:NADH-quinone oxidoreductase subunit C [Burkholderiaceae bacterium]